MEKSKRTFRGSYPAYALTYFFFYWSLGVFTSVLSMYLTGIGKSKAEMSFIMSASSLFGVVLIPIVGYINDKLRKPRLICTVMMACVAVFGILFALVRETMLLFLFNAEPRRHSGGKHEYPHLVFCHGGPDDARHDPNAVPARAEHGKGVFVKISPQLREISDVKLRGIFRSRTRLCNLKRRARGRGSTGSRIFL